MIKDLKKITLYCFLFASILCLLQLMNLEIIAIFLFWCFSVFIIFFTDPKR